MKNQDFLKQLAYDEVVIPIRNALAALVTNIQEAAIHEDMLFDWHVADNVNRCLNSVELFLSRLSAGEEDLITIKGYQNYLMSCRLAKCDPKLVMVKTVPKMKGISVEWGRINFESNGRYFHNHPVIRHRLIHPKMLKDINSDRKKRKLKPLQVIETEPSLETEQKYSWLQDVFRQEKYVASILGPKKISKNHPWLELTPKQRHFYRGFYSNNIEERRTFLEEYGISNALEAMEAELLDMDATTHNGTRALYKIKARANALVVSCSTTNRVYLIWVHKRLKTCADADKFISSGMSPENCVGAA